MVCGLMSSSAWWSAVFAGAIAMPFEPDGLVAAAGVGRRQRDGQLLGAP